MADLKISEMENASALGGTEQIPVVQGGANKKATAAQVATYTTAQAAASITIMACEQYGPTDDLNTFANGTIQTVRGDASNAPASGALLTFIVFTNKDTGNGTQSQLAIQVGGSGAGRIYRRLKPALSSYGSWSLINDPSA